MVPQPWGAPLYIALGHLVSFFSTDSNLPWMLTFWLSALPGALAVGFTYLAIREMKLGEKLALVGAGVLLACSIFLTQATVLREHMLPIMFVAAAYYFHVKGKYKLTVAMLGLGSAVHVIVGVLSVLWLVVLWKQWKPKLKSLIVVWVITGVAPYLLILGLMVADTPRWLAGGLSLPAVDNWLGSVGTIGQISVYDFPRRFYQALYIIIPAFGVALIPLLVGAWSNWKHKLLIATTLLYGLWLYATNIDETTWTFLSFAAPAAAVAAVVGLTKLPKWSTQAVMCGVVVLLGVNGILLNNAFLTNNRPEAMNYYQDAQALPSNALFLVLGGGPSQLGAVYFTTTDWGKDLAPVYLTDKDGVDQAVYKNYVKWISESKGLVGKNFIEQVHNALASGRPVFAQALRIPAWRKVIDADYITIPYNASFDQVVAEKSEHLELPEKIKQ